MHRWFRKSLLFPAEHGSWPWLLVPYLVGASIAGQWSPASGLVLLGGLSIFLLRQPATAWLRTRRGRGRKSDERVAAAWTLLFLLLSAVSAGGLIVLRQLALLWVLPPVVVLLVLYLTVAQINRARVRNLWMEIAGATGLAVMAPAAYATGRGTLDETAWLLWLLMALQNVLGVLYVRLRIADSHGRPEPRFPVLLSHLAGIGLAVLAASLSSHAWLPLVPFFFFSARAAWLAQQPRPIENMKRFGFVEVAVELFAGLWFIGSFLLS